MRNKDIVHMCRQNLSRRKSRTFLTVLGVVIGCCAIVIMVSIGIGMNESQEKMLAEMGDLTIIEVSPPQGGNGKIKLDDKAVAQFRQIAGTVAVSPKLTLDNYSVEVYSGVNDRYYASWSTVIGLDAASLEKMGYTLKSGSWISKSGQVLTGQYLAYDFTDTLRPQGSNTVDRWSGGYDDNGNPINSPDPYFDASTATYTLSIRSYDDNSTAMRFKFTAVGGMAENNGKGYETSGGIVMDLADLKQIIAKVSGSTKTLTYGTVLVKVNGIQNVESVENSIKGLGFSTYSMESIRKPMEKEARQKQLMLGGLGAISLFVAALGITNTMIMSISERTREIGIMKALGCYVRDIRAIFLGEAGIIGLMGGIIGCVISLLISAVINLVSFGSFSWQNLCNAIVGGADMTRTSVIPLWLFGFAIVFSVAIGLCSGYYPANKAVKIPALEAIKAE